MVFFFKKVAVVFRGRKSWFVGGEVLKAPLEEDEGIKGFSGDCGKAGLARRWNLEHNGSLSKLSVSFLGGI